MTSGYPFSSRSGDRLLRTVNSPSEVTNRAYTHGNDGSLYAGTQPVSSKGYHQDVTVGAPSAEDSALDALAAWLRARYGGVRVLGVGHRVVHGPDRLRGTPDDIVFDPERSVSP